MSQVKTWLVRVFRVFFRGAVLAEKQGIALRFVDFEEAHDNLML